MSTPKLAHFVLQTNRLAEMRDWYCTVLNATVVFENPGMCFLTFDEEHHRIALLQPPGEPLTERTPTTVGLQHSAYTFEDLRSLIDTYRRLRDQGLQPYMPIQHGVTTSLYYQDPDGNLVELQIDNVDDPEAATAYMMGEEYAADPIGPTFDPEAMAAALDGGVDPAVLTTRAWALGPGAPSSTNATV